MATIASEQPAMPLRYGPRTIFGLLILSATVGLNTVDRNMFGLLLPAIRQEIALSDASLGFLMGPAFVVVYSIVGVPLGWLADRTSRRGIVAAGLAAWSTVTIATGFAGSFVHLLIARMALGIGEASNMAPTSALIADTFAGRARVMAIAVFGAGGPLAMMLCYPLIGWLASTYGWRSAFPVMGAIGLLVALLVVLVVREPPRRAAQEDRRAVPFSAAAGMALSSRPLWLMIAAGTLLSINYSAMLAWLPTFMLRVHALDAKETGILIGMYKGGVGVIATFAAAFLVVRLMRFDRRWLAWAPALFCLVMAPAQLLLLLSDNALWWQVGLGVETVMLAATTPCTFSLVLALLDQRIRATGTAIYLLIFNLVGQSIGPMLIGLLNDGPLAFMGTSAIRYSLLIAPAVIAVSALFFLALGRHLDRAETGQECGA